MTSLPYYHTHSHKNTELPPLNTERIIRRRVDPGFACMQSDGAPHGAP